MSEPSAVLDLEQEFLDHLTDKQSLEYIIRSGFNPDFLNTPLNKSVYQFAQFYYQQNGEAPSAIILRTEFPNLDLFMPEATASYIVDRLRDRFTRNELQTITRRLATLTDNPQDGMAFLRDQAMQLERKTISTQTIWTAADAEHFIERAQQKILDGQYKGFSTGFAEVDKFCGGMRPGYLTGLAARPKRQKTFIALQSFIAQIVQGHTPVLFTLENTEEEIWNRLGCMVTGVSWDKMQKGEMMPADWKALHDGWEEFRGAYDPRFYIARPAIGERTVPSLLLQADKLEADSIVISQFKYIEPTREYLQAHEKWGSIVVDLKLGAIRPGSERPIYVETQLNREATSMTEMMDADLAQLGLTDMWGQACDLMFGLYQNKDMRASHLTEFGIIEARNSDKNSWYIHSEFKERTELTLQ
jgi:replicative DNA helicase